MTTKISKNVYIRDGIIYVQGSIDKKFKRYSTGKADNKLNRAYHVKNWKQVLLKLNDKKVSEQTVNMSEIFNEFALYSLKVNSVNRSESTNEEYLSIFKKYIKNYFKDLKLTDIKKATLQEWQNGLLTKDISIGRVIFVRAVMSGILNDAYDNELIEKNYLALVKVPKDENPEENINPFTLNDIQAILNASTGQNKNLFTVLFFTGMRTGECLALKWSDIDFRNKTIHIQRSVRHGKIGSTKTKNSNRVIDMLPLVEEALIRQKTFTLVNDSFVFLTIHKSHYSTAQTISEGPWARALQFANLDYRYLYQTRHTFASLMISNNEDPLWVSKTLGHANLNITLTVYAKFVPDTSKQRATFLNEFKKKTAQILHTQN